MLPVQFNADHCVMTRFASTISGKGKPILLYLIENGVNRFSRILQQMPAISKKMLTEQLRELEADGLIRRDELKVKAPKVVVYHLTEKGASLRKLIDHIIQWCLEYMKEDVARELVEEFSKKHPPVSAQLPWIHKK
jgi:DNA-binding HxlR family transcriptional regulator